MSNSYSIGQLAQVTGVPAKTIRYYEDAGLLPKPQRRGNGYRTYGQRDAHILSFVKRARDLGFSVEQVSQLLELWSNRRRQSKHVKRLASEHLEEIERKIAELENLRSLLTDLIHHCHGDERPDCPILEELGSV